MAPINTVESLDSRLGEILFWLRESKRLEEIQEQRTSESTTTVNFTTMNNIWNSTENSTSALPVANHHNQDLRVSLMMDLWIFITIFAICCVIGLVAWCKNRRNKKSSCRESDEEEIIELSPEDGIRQCKFRFWWPEMAASKKEGFVTLSDSGEVVDVKYWTMEQLDDYFKEKCFKIGK